MYGISEFVDVVAKSNAGKVDVIVLESADFHAWVGGYSQAKVKSKGAKLADMVRIQVRRGSHKMHFKVDHDADEFKTLDFLKRTHRAGVPSTLREGCWESTPARRQTLSHSSAH